jgi:hypothetical protein
MSAGVLLGVVVRGHRDAAQRRLLDAVLVHEAHGLHRVLLCGRHDPVGLVERLVPGDGRRLGALPEPAELALGERAEHDHGVGDARVDGRRRVGDRA